MCFESAYLWKSKFPCRNQVYMNRDEEILIQGKENTTLNALKCVCMMRRG